MIEPPQKLLKQAVAAFCRYIEADDKTPEQQEILRTKAESLAKAVSKAMKARDENEELVVWEELNRHAHRKIENKRLKALGVEGF